jgi:hypothetical protein
MMCIKNLTLDVIDDTLPPVWRLCIRVEVYYYHRAVVLVLCIYGPAADLLQYTILL